MSIRQTEGRLCGAHGHLRANLGAMLIGWVITGMLGITLSYHRQLSHKAFTTPKWLEYALAYCGVMAMQVRLDIQDVDPGILLPPPQLSHAVGNNACPGAQRRRDERSERGPSGEPVHCCKALAITHSSACTYVCCATSKMLM